MTRPRPSAALTAALLLLAHARPCAAAPTADSLARYLDGLDAFGFCGQVVASTAEGTRIERALGFADARRTRVTPHTGFAVGSVTKSFTAALILRLASEGRLSLDDSLATLLEGVPADKAAITPRELLSHTAGLPEDAEGVFERDARAQIVRATLAAKLPAAPGERFGYSNAGFQLLAAIAEQVTSRPWPRLVDSLLLAPLELRETGAGSAYARTRNEHAVGRNEWLTSGSFHDWRQPWAGSGAGDLVTTAHDFARWGEALRDGFPPGVPTADAQTARHALVNGTTSYGYGLWLIARAGRSDMVLIGGDIPGYHAGMWFERDGARRLVAVTNAGERWGRRLPVAAVQRAVWRLLDGQPVELPPATIEWPRDRVAALAGDWTLAPAGRLTLVPEGRALRLQLAGAEAMALVEGADSSGVREFVEGRTSDLVRAAVARDDSAIARVLLPVEAGWSGALRTLVAEHEQANGPTTGATIEGTVSLPWLARGTRTFVTLHAKRGDSRLSLAWLDRGLLDVAGDDGRPAPVILPVAPLAEGGLAAWDLLDGTTVRLRPFADAQGPGLRLEGAGVTFVARRRKH